MEPADSDDVAADTEGTVAGTVELSDGGSLPVALDADLVESAREEGVDVERLHAAAVPSSATVDMTAQTDGDTTSTIPVQDHQQTDLTNRLRRDREHRFIEDDQIQRLIRNSVNYTERVGRFLMDRDDLIPTVKERIKSLIVGEDGLTVEPSDPDDDADQRLADHLKDIYRDDVRPGEVIDRILRENLMNARAVLRATDLKELDLNTLDYLRDGVSGEEIYVQDETTVYEFSVEDDGDTDAIPGIDLERQTVDAQPLVIGDHVFDISLYDTPPLEAVADTAVNKMVLQRLKARKAEITSFGAVYAKVEPPSYLPESQYFDRVDDDDWDGDGEPPTKLERALKSNIQNAFDTLKDFQSGTVMSVPDFWSLEQLEIPETGDPIDEQIRGYNRDISRRLLVPLDLIELQSGSELSRETMFRTLMTTIAGWRKEIVRIFDNYADIQAEIEGLDQGEVVHKFPALKDANTQQIVSALQYAGVAGLSQKEVRTMMNAIQGVDLDTDADSGGAGPPGGPSAGGPDGGQQRQEQMEEMLEQQRRGQSDVEAARDDADTDDFQATVFHVLPPEDSDMFDDTDQVIGLGIDFPNSDVYVDWRNSQFPDELTHPHVSIYGSVDDLTQATNNRTREVETMSVEAATEIIDPDSVEAQMTAANPDGVPDDAIQFGNVGGDPFGDEDMLDSFVEALFNVGAEGVWAGSERWGDHSGIHDRPVYASGISIEEAKTVWGTFQDDAVGLMSPSEGKAEAGGGQGNVSRAGGAGPGKSPANAAADQDGSDGPAPTGRAAEILDAVPFLPDADGDGPVRIPSDRLKDWLAWVRAGRPSLEADWNPTLHPRGPDGAFVERPYDIPDEIQDEIDDLSTPETLDRLAGTSELSDDDLDALLGDGGVRIDGIPDDASSRQDLREAADSGDGDIGDGDGPDLSGYDGDEASVRGWSGSLARTALNRMTAPSRDPERYQAVRDKVADQLGGQELGEDPGDGPSLKLTPAESSKVVEALRDYKDVIDQQEGPSIMDPNDDQPTSQRLQTAIMEFSTNFNDGDGTDAQEAMTDAGYVSPDAPDMRVSEADSVESLLDDPEGSVGSAASNMDVARFDDGTTAFVKRYRDDVDGPRADGENPTNAEREVAADNFLRNIGMDQHLPGLFNNEDEGYAASEKVEGDQVRLSTPDGAAEVDEDEFKDFAAATLLAGNSDLHGDNWRVQDDGSFYAIDLNKSGGDFTEDGKFRRRGRNMLTNVADTMGIDLDADELTQRTTELAQEIDTEAALDGVPNSDLSDLQRHQFRENIRNNIEAFAAGEVDL